jgi:hypothetical protein
MKVQFAALTMTFGIMWGACSSPSANPQGTGGSTTSGGALGSGGRTSSGGAVGAGSGGSTGSGGAAASCSNTTSCGGSVVGTWTVSSSCVQVGGALDLSLVAARCTSPPVTGSLQVTGTFTANADGTYTDNTVTSGNERFPLDAACLVISSTQTTCAGAASIISSLGYATVDCTAASGGGCDCTATIQPKGTLGIVSGAPSTTGNYTTSGNVVTISGDSGDAPYAYCVSGDKMTLTPQTSSPTTTGTIVFQKAGAIGSGGRVGSGGGTASGGRVGSGGTGQAGGVGSGGRGGGGGVSGSGGAGTGGAGATAGSTGTTEGPCDIYKSGGTPCVAAHGTVRALFGAYAGKLYQVRNSAGTTKDISAVTAGGVADSAAQDTFCSGTTCVITIIYDQTGKGLDLEYQGSGSTPGGKDQPAKATGESVKVGGNKVYSLYINPGNSYWVDGSKLGIPTGSQPEGMYMVTSGTHSNTGCCFDYGNSETTRDYQGPGTMDALNFSSTTSWGTGAGAGPWVMADLEAGLFSQGSSGKNPSDPTQTAPFVTAVLKNNGTTEWTLKGGDATTGSLSTYYKGALPGGWSPMKKQGAIVLGSGGDCCATNTNQSAGTFYEGCIVSGYPSDATESAVQANIVAAGYSK